MSELTDFLLGFALLAAVLVVGIRLLAGIAGWRALERQYRANAPPAGQRHWVQAGLRWNVSVPLAISADDAGLHLRFIPLYRFAGAPLFVPWSDVLVSEESFLILEFTRFDFSRVAGVPLRLGPSVAGSLLAAGPRSRRGVLGLS